MRLTPIGLWSALGLAGCARDVVVLEPIEEEAFELAYKEAECRSVDACEHDWEISEEECDLFSTSDRFSEGKWWLLIACPDAVYDPLQAAACLDQLLHSPGQCGPSVACGNMDWYRGACPEVNIFP